MNLENLKLCKDCKFSEYYEFLGYMCSKNVVKYTEINYTTGGLLEKEGGSLLQCQEHRQKGECGEEAKFFEPLPKLNLSRFKDTIPKCEMY